ncbi:diguanylate cyclase [Vibrio sp. M60_M31a]
MTKTDLDQAFMVAERVRKSIESHEFDTVGNVTISVGISRWDGTNEPINAVLKNADDALYQAKTQWSQSNGVEILMILSC